jgi:hypothetical protein
MLFVADGFPEELVRVIEFLNEQMSPAGVVLGIEVRQYTDPDRIQQVLVPRVVGATSVAERTKATSGATKWTRATLVDEATVAATPEVIAQLDRSLDAAEASGVQSVLGQRPDAEGVGVAVDRRGASADLGACTSGGPANRLSASCEAT